MLIDLFVDDFTVYSNIPCSSFRDTLSISMSRICCQNFTAVVYAINLLQYHVLLTIVPWVWPSIYLCFILWSVCPKSVWIVPVCAPQKRVCFLFKHQNNGIKLYPAKQQHVNVFTIDWHANQAQKVALSILKYRGWRITFWQLCAHALLLCNSGGPNVKSSIDFLILDILLNTFELNSQRAFANGAWRFSWNLQHIETTGNYVKYVDYLLVIQVLRTCSIFVYWSHLPNRWWHKSRRLVVLSKFERVSASSRIFRASPILQQ